jgi:hypothetical protein
VPLAKRVLALQKPIRNRPIIDTATPLSESDLRVIRFLSLSLALVLLLTGSGALAGLHVVAEEGGHDSAHVLAADAQQHPQPADHDEQHCKVCLTLQATYTAYSPFSFEVAMRQSVQRAVALQQQRLETSVPARRGCRGPPVA